jgi:hypothetical protein
MNANRIYDFSEAEILADRAASEEDIKICQIALELGITHHKDGLAVKERLDVNRRIIIKIDAELKCRKEAV